MIESQIKKKVASWRWRMVKSCGNVKKFCEASGWAQSQISDWLTGAKTPNPASVDAVEADLKRLGV